MVGEPVPLVHLALGEREVVRDGTRRPRLAPDDRGPTRGLGHRRRTTQPDGTGSRIDRGTSPGRCCARRAIQRRPPARRPEPSRTRAHRRAGWCRTRGGACRHDPGRRDSPRRGPCGPSQRLGPDPGRRRSPEPRCRRRDSAGSAGGSPGPVLRQSRARGVGRAGSHHPSPALRRLDDCLRRHHQDRPQASTGPLRRWGPGLPGRSGGPTVGRPARRPPGRGRVVEDAHHHLRRCRDGLLRPRWNRFDRTGCLDQRARRPEGRGRAPATPHLRCVLPGQPGRHLVARHRQRRHQVLPDRCRRTGRRLPPTHGGRSEDPDGRDRR